MGKDKWTWKDYTRAAVIALLIALCVIEAWSLRKLYRQNEELGYYVSFQEQITVQLVKRCIDGR